MVWGDALHGRNKEVRADASTIIVENPPNSSELSDDFDSERALKLLNTKAERGVTKEAMFILLCLQSNPDNVGILADYFIRKEHAPYGAPSVSDQSYLIFKEFLVKNKVEPNQFFDASEHLSNERIRTLFVELVSDYEPFIKKLKQEFFVDSFSSYITMSNVKLLLELLGEKDTFDLILKITTENLGENRHIGNKWFGINQNGGRKLWNSEYVEKHLVEICQSETSMILEKGKRKGGDEYFLYGAITGLGTNFGSEENIRVIFDSFLKLKTLKYELTFHHGALGDNLEIASKLMTDELTKEHSPSDYDLICDHFFEIFNGVLSHVKQYYSEDIKQLIRVISPNVSSNHFEHFVKYPQSFFELDELESLAKLVAYARFGYDEDMDSSELDDFIQNNLYECSYLLHAVKDFARNGSEIAKKWLAQDSINSKIDSMFACQDYSAIASLLEGLESAESFDSIVDHIISKSNESKAKKKTILNSINYNKPYREFGQFIVDELTAIEHTKETTQTKLVVEAAIKYMIRFTHDDLSFVMVSKISSIIGRLLSSKNDLSVLKHIFSNLSSIRLSGQPKEEITNYLLSILETIPIEIRYNAASCLNKLGAWNELIEDTILDAIDEHMDSPQLLHGHIHQLRTGSSSSDNAMNKVLNILINHENMVVKMFAIDCLGWKNYQPSVPHIIEVLRLGTQSDEEMTYRSGYAKIKASPPQLATFATKDVFTSAVLALARLSKYSVDYLLEALSNDNDEIALGAFLAFELHQTTFKEVVFSKEQENLMQELRKKAARVLSNPIGDYRSG